MSKTFPLGKERHLGYTVYFGKFWFTLARRLFGRHWLIVPKDWNTYQRVLGTHFKGINRKGEKFVVQIRYGGSNHWIGVYPTVEEALEARLAAEKEHWGIVPRREHLHAE